ncbi:hypothetical protein L1049_015713 [Liquidambar formosana]|uniref:RING-type E3 ubiquitin transferase n=1 Tax=Liquidambar formosana TaxID=63359 RepID=A0AAP0S5B3_LIQFO
MGERERFYSVLTSKILCIKGALVVFPLYLSVEKRETEEERGKREKEVREFQKRLYIFSTTYLTVFIKSFHRSPLTPSVFGSSLVALMQGQRSTIDSYPETVDFDQGSVSNNTSMNQQTSWNNLFNPVENRLPNYMLSSTEANFTCGNTVGHDVRSFSGWVSGEPSSSNPPNPLIDDGIKIENGWSSSFSARAGAGPRLEERRLQPTNIPLHENVNVGSSGNMVSSGPLFLQSSNSNCIPQNVNLNAGYMSNGGNNGQGMGSGVSSDLCKSGGSESAQIPSASFSSANVGTSSGSSGFVVEENDGGSGSSLGSWGLSCKRKALEGTSGQSYPGGSSSCFTQAENSVWHTVPARNNASNSLSISTPPGNSSSVSTPEQLNPRIGVGMRGVASDVFPSLSVTGNAESSFRNFGRRVNSGHQQESVPFNLSSAGNARRSNVCTPHQSSRPFSFVESLELRSTAGVAANTSASPSQSHVHIPGLSRTLHPFPWNGASSSRAGSSSGSINLSGERGVALREEANLRSTSRNNGEHPMFVPATETRTLGQDPTNWSLATGNMSTPGVVPSTSRIGTSSSVHPLPTPSWITHHNPPIQNQQRLSGFSPWTLFPSVDSESGSQSAHFPPLPSGPSASSQETVTPSGPNSQGHHQPYPRSALLMEGQGDEILGMPHSLRALAADIEGRHRLISEIRQVLNAMRRGHNLRVEDYMLFDPIINHGMAEFHDRHREMRLDVDNMSYEELLALEEHIGDVSTGLSEETILKSMKQRKYMSIMTGTALDVEPCCVCQEEYAVGDDVGTLVCGHDFHTHCIKQWLMQKNLCPICKTTALVP